MGKETPKEVNVTINSCLSLFDEQFDIEDFNASLEHTSVETESVLNSTRAAVYKAFNDEENANYVVDMDQEMKAALDSGKIELVANDSGELFAQLRNGNGRFGKRLPIKKELEDAGISADMLQMALQMEAIKAQLQTILEGMKEIEGRVTDVIQGQRNDRIGLFYSGLSLYVESKSIKDELLRKQITAQALKSISDANSQMIQDIRTSVEYLITEQYLNSKKIKENIKEHLSIINQCYDVVYRAAFLKATIYQENGEIASMLTAIDEYGRFVERMIVPYAGKLSELDESNKFIETGTWGTIANTLTGCRELKEQISNSNTYYLSMEGSKDGE
ncbi:MAG: hypothetical protein EOM34_16145 [Clostridia bacterium]|nr:hypothetical protein [Clostridia bacterium]